MKGKFKKIASIALSTIFIVSSLNIEYSFAENTKEANITEELYGQMTSERINFSVELYNDKAYVFGGKNNDGSFSNKVEVFDLNTKEWSTVAEMPDVYDFAIATCLYKNKVYLLGDASRNIYVFDLEQNTWSIECTTTFSTIDLTLLKLEAYNDKIHIIGGFSKLNYTYDLKTKEFTQLANMPDYYSEFECVFLNGNIYVVPAGDSTGTIPFYNLEKNTWNTTSAHSGYLMNANVLQRDEYIYMFEIYGNKSEILRYDTLGDTWEKNTYNASNSLLKTTPTFLKNGKIYSFGGMVSMNMGTDKIYAYKISDEKSKSEIVEDILDEIENGNFDNATDLENLILKLPNNSVKEDLIDRYEELKDAIPEQPEFPGLTPEKTTSNVDVYIESENMIAMSLDTSSITFDDFDGVNDLEKLGAVKLTVNSSLPYELNAYLPTEIQNGDKTKTIDKSILNIRENSQTEYKTFANTNEKVTLKDNNVAGNNTVHTIDLKLKGGLAHEADVYKATIKFEINQK